MQLGMLKLIISTGFCYHKQGKNVFSSAKIMDEHFIVYVSY